MGDHTHSLVGDRDKCLAAGMDGYLSKSKPLDPNEVEAAVERYLPEPEAGGTDDSPAVVLVIQNQAAVRALVSTALRCAGLQTVEAADGKEGLRRFFEAQPDLVVLDMMMPGLDGLELLGRIRDLSEVPVLMLTSRDGELEKVRALRSGADDYVTKPFGRLELAARVETLLRRSPRATDTRSVLSDDLVTIDFQHAAATMGGNELTLTPLEFKLLATFVRHRNQVLSPEQIADQVWGQGGASRDQVKLYVSYLRRRMRDAASFVPIETVRGFGYRYRSRPSVPKESGLAAVTGASDPTASGPCGSERSGSRPAPAAMRCRTRPSPRD